MKDQEENVLPIEAEDIHRIEDFLLGCFAHWDLKKVENLPVWSHQIDSPTQKLYKIATYFRGSINNRRESSGRYLELSIAWITYDGVYKIKDNPNEDIVNFCNRLERFGYKISNVRNQWCRANYSRKYVNPEHHSDLKPHIEYKQFEVRRNDKEF